jgi:hypothetical protein
VRDLGPRGERALDIIGDDTRGRSPAIPNFTRVSIRLSAIGQHIASLGLVVDKPGGLLEGVHQDSNTMTFDRISAGEYSVIAFSSQQDDVSMSCDEI